MKDLIIRLFRFRLKAVVVAGVIIAVSVVGISVIAFHHKSSPAQPIGTAQTPDNDTQSQDGATSDSDKSGTSTEDKAPAKTAAPSTSKNNSSSGGTATGSGASGGTNTGSTGGGAPTPPAVCPALPAFPDENCTGYAHTGVTLHTCTAPLVNATYDSCLFTGEVNVSADNVKITRSKIVGYISYRTIDAGSLRGLSLTDVEIDSTDYTGGATIGNNDYTCIRCNVHGGTRGFNVGYNVLVRDSYAHGWHSQNGDHITGLGSNGGAHNIIDHNNISCDVLNDSTGFACSSGLSVYGDDSPGNDDWKITNNLLNSASSYCMIIAGPPSKQYPFTNMVVTGNHFGNMGARARGLPDSQCTEYGPINLPGGGVHDWNTGTTNTWSSNVDSDENTVAAPS